MKFAPGDPFPAAVAAACHVDTPGPPLGKQMEFPAGGIPEPKLPTCMLHTALSHFNTVTHLGDGDRLPRVVEQGTVGVGDGTIPGLVIEEGEGEPGKLDLDPEVKSQALPGSP